MIYGEKKYQVTIVIIILMLTISILYASSPRNISTKATTFSTEKHVLLTFDDGPNPKYTPDILNTLQQHDIKAMFFVVGQAVKKHPDIVKEIHNNGHVVANHTYTHSIIKGLSKEELTDEVKKTDIAINDIVGYSPLYFRPPTGAYSQSEFDVLRDFGKNVLMWDFGLEKRKIKTSDGLVTHIIKRIRKSNKQVVILLLHDGDPTNKYDRRLTTESLPELIQALKDDGFTFLDPKEERGRNIINNFIKENPKFDVY